MLAKVEKIKESCFDNRNCFFELPFRNFICILHELIFRDFSALKYQFFVEQLRQGCPIFSKGV